MKIMPDDATIAAYATLVDSVRALDSDAAAYLLDGVFALESFNFGASLQDSFIWCSSPQGHDYWCDLHRKLTGAK